MKSLLLVLAIGHAAAAGAQTGASSTLPGQIESSGASSTLQKQCGRFEVTSAWSRLAPPTAPVLAGYLTLANRGDETLVLSGARSASFERVELHSMSMDNGVMRMRKLERVEIEPGRTLELAPGGKHLMLIGPKRPFAAGERIPVELELCAGKPALRVELEVRGE